MVRTYFELTRGTASDIEGQLAARLERLRRRLASVRHTFAVMSGKGGVGKSVLAANLAAALAADGLRVGVVDADMNGPSMARLLGVPRSPLRVTDSGVEPAVGAAGVRVMSMDLLLAGDERPVDWKGPRHDTFLWRGTLEANALREFLSDTLWGTLDFLVLDLPPGADRIAPVHDLLPDLGGVVLVTLPSALSRFVVRKSLTAVLAAGVPVIGYVENMVGYICPDCGARGPLFESDGAGFEGVPRLAEVPFDSRFGGATDAGSPDVLDRPEAPASRAIREIADRIRSFFGDVTP